MVCLRSQRRSRIVAEPLSAAELASRLARLPKPVRRLKSNAAPMLFPAEDAPECCKGRELGLEELERRAETLAVGYRIAGAVNFCF